MAMSVADAAADGMFALIALAREAEGLRKQRDKYDRQLDISVASGTQALALAKAANARALKAEAERDAAREFRRRGYAVVEAAIEVVWDAVRLGHSSGNDGLDAAVAAFQIATGAAEEDGPEALLHARATARSARPQGDQP